MDSSGLEAMTALDFSGFIAGAYGVAALIGLWMWLRSAQMLKRAEKTLGALENKP